MNATRARRPGSRVRGLGVGLLLTCAALALTACGNTVQVRGNTPVHPAPGYRMDTLRSEEHTSELQSLMRISYAVFCLKKHTHSSKSTVIRTLDITLRVN